jgi:hypothetical protein
MIRSTKVFERYLQRRLARRWRRLASDAQTMKLSQLRALQTEARAFRSNLETVLMISDNRLSGPGLKSNAIAAQKTADWVWRPSIWRGGLLEPGIIAAPNQSHLGADTTLFHDCKTSEISIRQIRNKRASDLAPFGVRLEIFGFEGSFLSLALDAPPDALAGLSKRNVLVVEAILQSERPINVYARLNIRHGPNVASQLAHLPRETEATRAEFDLAYTDINDRRLEQMWVDLIFEDPAMNEVVLRDVTFSRIFRADL